MSENKAVSNVLKIGESLIPVVLLVCLLAYNIFFSEGVLFGDYSNQYILLLAAFAAIIIGVNKKIAISLMIKEIYNNLKSVLVPVLILFLVGALAGTWLISGVIPAMVYYGLRVLSAEIFLPAAVIISAIISIATGSSWTTSATVGIALVGVGTALGIPPGMVAGAVISGAYFGDKMSPLSDTTNLAPAMAGTDLFTHIKYMSLTTVPTLLVTLLVFTIISLNLTTTGDTDLSEMFSVIEQTFYITPWLFAVPVTVIGLILLKVKPLLALLSGVVLAAIFAVYFQSNVVLQISGSYIDSISQAVLTEVEIVTSHDALNELFASGGMEGMIWTILLIVSAMVFGGVMDGIGALGVITEYLLKRTKTTLDLFFATVASCLGLNIIASDQYLAIVIPGKMFKKAFEEKNLAPENLSRTLEDSGTVTSVLIPWNTCGAYQSSVLGVSVSEYFIFAIFNYLSPITTLIFAALNLKIRHISK
ncbi:Na+/H+ antiporter NhaC family protein [Flavicella sp.]|uniref:Na+/H+ antiporter NhaC family protein n=1 Tax=Flavicella sp. TaxID=2957742 RepID=UPI0026125EEE|nr:Na+/H+ antiporter NhaC family protein [Flavicella sp.]MDG1805058.1 Na+/H+ antiporter NhaC family protein [Flavicella sp.]